MNGAIVSSPSSSNKNTTYQKSNSCLHIACEAVLMLERLVQEILHRRPKIAKRYENNSEQQQKVWTSELVDVVNSHILNIVIKFARGKARYPVVCIVTIDMKTQLYKEQWMKSRSNTDYGSIDMREVCCNIRMRFLKVGPFATSGDETTGETEESIDDSVGLHYSNRKTMESCFMPLSVLYSDTQVVSNSNILAAIPKMRMKSHSPLELVYFA
jgi:hypothetical protein